MLTQNLLTGYMRISANIKEEILAIQSYYDIDHRLAVCYW